MNCCCYHHYWCYIKCKPANNIISYRHTMTFHDTSWLIRIQNDSFPNHHDSCKALNKWEGKRDKRGVKFMLKNWLKWYKYFRVARKIPMKAHVCTSQTGDEPAVNKAMLSGSLGDWKQGTLLTNQRKPSSPSNSKAANIRIIPNMHQMCMLPMQMIASAEVSAAFMRVIQRILICFLLFFLSQYLRRLSHRTTCE